MIQRSFFILILVCNLVLSAVNCAPEKEKSMMMVTAESGLILRESPSTDGKPMVTIPHGTAVTVSATTGNEITIAGRTGKWSQITWNHQTGWVFGGFLKPIANPTSSGESPDQSNAWSAYQGVSNFVTAESKCATAGMRLPSPDEIQSAANSGLTKSWEKPSTSNYWSSGHRTPESIIAVNIDTGTPSADMFHVAEDQLPYRCIR